MRFLRCAPQVAATIASALLFAEANVRNSHYSVDDIIHKQDEVTAFEETLRKAEDLIRKSRTKKDALETPSVDGEGRQLNPKKKKGKTSKKDKTNQCLARVESLEKKIDEMEQSLEKEIDKNKEIKYLYVQESEQVSFSTQLLILYSE